MRFRLLLVGLVAALLFALGTYDQRVNAERALKLQCSLNQPELRMAFVSACPAGYYMGIDGWCKQGADVRAGNISNPPREGYFLPGNPPPKQKSPITKHAPGDHAVPNKGYVIPNREQVPAMEIEPADEGVLKFIKHRIDLINTMTTRVATAAEMQEFLDTGPSIFAPVMGFGNGGSTVSEDTEKFISALRVQNEIRKMTACKKEVVQLSDDQRLMYDLARVCRDKDWKGTISFGGPTDLDCAELLRLGGTQLLNEIAE